MSFASYAALKPPDVTVDLEDRAHLTHVSMSACRLTGPAAPSMSRDGRFVVFTTKEPLLPSDSNANKEDVYFLQLRP